jgi:(S)-2-hydroxyglutarate dehydrogenase
MRRHPKVRLLVLEKESQWGHHQTGHNSGEIHSGIYYRPGSLKANFCRDGNQAMVKFCREYGVPHEICGKVIVATDQNELPLLEVLYQRSRLNGISAMKLCPEEIREIEPHCTGLAGLRVPSTGIVDYRRVAETLAELIRKRGGVVRLNTEVKNIHLTPTDLWIESPRSTFETRFLVNCAGLHSDRIAKLMGLRTGMRIVPIRGEYYRLIKEKQHLVKTLIYPVPNPRFPFLGVHFNRQIDGQVRVGPNAVLSLKREGYRKTAVGLRDAVDLLSSRAFWLFVASHWREGGKEQLRSVSKTLFVRQVRRLMPNIRSTDLVAASTGVRAQAVTDNGRVMDDFVILRGPRSLHVCNAPSPAATAAIPIGEAVVDRVQEQGVIE